MNTDPHALTHGDHSPKYNQPTDDILYHTLSIDNVGTTYDLLVYCLLASYSSDNLETEYISIQNSQRQSLKTTQLNMIQSILVLPAAPFSTRGRLQRNAVVVVLRFAFICAVFLSTHQILASAQTSSRTDEHHEVKVWFLNSSHFEVYKLEYAPISCFKQLKIFSLSVHDAVDHSNFEERSIAG